MLDKWVAPLEIAALERDILHRSAWAQPHSARDAIEILDWETLGEVLAAKPAASTLVCARGEQLHLPAPRNLAEVRRYLDSGIGLAMRHTQRCHPKLAALAARFGELLVGEVQVQIFVTPGRTYGFGWHYDAEHVFIAQTVGSKDYYFRENTVETDAPFPPQDFFSYRHETSALQTACLIAGDFLYIPPKWWHMAVAREDSLSISVGVSSTKSP